jgi:molybdate transport system permease protein
MPFSLSPSEWSAIWLSLKVATSVAVVTIVPAVLLGWFLARREFRGKILVESLVHAPLVMPPVVTGYLLLVVFGRHGFMGQWLESWFGIRLIFTWQGAVLASAIVALPLAVRSVRLAISLVDQRLEEAAQTLGYHPLRVFFKVTLPLAWPGILGGILLAFSRSLGEFGATITFAGNIEGSTQTLPLAIYSALQVPGEETVAMRVVIASLVLCFASLLISELLTRKAKRRVSVTTEK